MRLILFTDSNAFAGTERHMLALGKSLQHFHINVSIACPFPSPLATAASGQNIPIIPIAKRGAFLDRAAIKILRRLLRSGEIDLIHSHNGRTALAASIAVWLAGRGRCILTQHFINPAHASRRGPKALLSRLAHKWMRRHTHAHIAISSAVRDAMVSRDKLPPESIPVVPNGISAPDQPDAIALAKVRTDLNVPAGTPLVLCASRLEPEKDIQSLIEAADRLRQKKHPFKIAIAGVGSQESSLRQLIKDRQLEEHVTLLGFRNDVLNLIAAADIFVLPSRAEPFGLVLLEAMALGKPVIATAAGGPLEIVQGDKTGLFVPPADPAALAEAILRLSLDPHQCAEMGRQGRVRFHDAFTADRMAQATIEVYRKVLGTNGAAEYSAQADAVAAP